MFELKALMPQAQEVATKDPERFEVGRTGWVTARFTTERPLPEEIWREWLAESYDLTYGTETMTK
jgi:hypothetical protein